ncbi:hypothetical protein ACOMHN_029618 [Nucella lapillus]
MQQRSGRKRRHKAACACCQATPGLPTPPQQEQDPPQQVLGNDPPQQVQNDPSQQMQDDPPQQGQDPPQVDNVLPQQQNALQNVPPSLTKAEQARQRRQQAKRVREQAAEDRLFEVDIHLCRVASVEAYLLSLTEGEVTEGRILRGINRAVIASEPDADAPLSLSAACLMDVADPHSFSLRSPRLLP